MPKCLVDRRTKVRCALSRIEERDFEWRQQGNVGTGPAEKCLIGILSSAGICDTKTASMEVLIKCGFQKFFDSSDIENPTSSDERRDLELLLEAAERFSKAAGHLANKTRLRLIDSSIPGTTETRRDPYEVSKLTDAIALGARLAIPALPLYKGGRPRKVALANSVYGLQVIWWKYGPQKKGIGRSGTRAAYGRDEYKGPLLEMAVKILKLEGIPFASRNAVGQMLLSHDNRARKEADRQRESSWRLIRRYYRFELNAEHLLGRCGAHSMGK